MAEVLLCVFEAWEVQEKGKNYNNVKWHLSNVERKKILVMGEKEKKASLAQRQGLITMHLQCDSHLSP